MFNYTKEVIINSLKVNSSAYGGSEKIDKVIGNDTLGLLKILRSGEYRKEYVNNGKVYKTVGNAGTNASLSLDFSSTTATIFNKIGIYRLVISVRMNGKYLSDFAHADNAPFYKPIIVEFSINSTTKTIAEVNTIVLNAINLAIPYGNEFAKAYIDTNVLKVGLYDPYAFFDFYEVSIYENGEYTPIVPASGKFVKTDNVQPFGTGEWIQENLRFPTYYNNRWAALNEDEKPQLGAIYTEYTFEYSVPREGLRGLSAVGQKVESVTNHVFYVLNSLVTDFEAEVLKAFGAGSIVTDKSDQPDLTDPEPDTE